MPRRQRFLFRYLRRAIDAALVLGLASGPWATAWAGGASLPSFEALEAAGARIGTIRVIVRDIFDLDDPDENNLLFRTANRLHLRTRPEVIERTLQFRTGDPVSVRRIEESERLLRSTRFLYDVRIEPVAINADQVDIEVTTRDTWTFEPGISLSRSGGENTGSVAIREYNLLGTGTAVAFSRFRNVDRVGTEFGLSADRVLGSALRVALVHADNSDGSRRRIQLSRPFQSLDTRWAAGVDLRDDDRIEPVYNAGEIVSHYREQRRQLELFAGLSTGRIGPWVQRWTVGVQRDARQTAAEPGLQPPAALPDDETLVGPFLRYELLEERFERALNLSQIGRPEFLPLGLSSRIQLARAAKSLGSSRDLWLYEASISRGFEPAPRQRLLASATAGGRYGDDGFERLALGTRAQYFWPQSPRWGLYALIQADAIHNPAPLDVLMLGGDNGLRGYPLRYQSGTRRVLLTLEERLYTDLYWFRLFRIGAAAFFDLGRAWGGPDVNASNPGWLADVGIGLRIFSVRSAFANTLHIDLAVPLNADPTMKRVQLVVSTRASF